jgi:hypothetical protein
MRVPLLGGWLLVVIVVGCGGSTVVADDMPFPTDADAGDATANDSGGDASDASADASFSCGAETCQPSELCFKPCSGGISQCVPYGDGGTCPPGTHTDIMCTSQGTNRPCAPDAPPPYCSPNACQTGLFWGQSGHDCIQVCQ